ncbi:hypothetical protein GBAR_LOCUS14694 [Geodia barretti]|uniref:Uncharacterized protein n=1 Tax=Geodia barretti TaxID=519541 RepID=A0AA35S931_GEOBA|nr:hypothetical protein GBAR_LOCUS14694 [Geodia barretti]
MVIMERDQRDGGLTDCHSRTRSLARRVTLCCSHASHAFLCIYIHN